MRQYRIYEINRVCTGEQNLSQHLDVLLQTGCDMSTIFVDKSSEGKTERPDLNSCLKELQPEDTLLVWQLDRLRRYADHGDGVTQ